MGAYIWMMKKIEFYCYLIRSSIISKSLLSFSFLILLANVTLGQSRIDEPQHNSDTIKLYVNEKSKIILNGNKSNLTMLENLLQTQKISHAKFATIFPTPLKVFATAEKVDLLLRKYHVTSTWYKDPEYTKLAFD
jgi:hypothetical protein